MAQLIAGHVAMHHPTSYHSGDISKCIFLINHILSFQGKELSFGMRVLPCQSTPGIEIYGHAPQVNSKNFSHIFNHKELYDVPGR